MPKINLKVVKELYSVAEKFHQKMLSITEAKSRLNELGINPNSSTDYIYNYSNLVSGKLFTRTMNVISTKYYLEKILEIQGEKVLKKALQSLSLHIDYYEGISKSKVKKRKEILNKYLKEYLLSADDFYGEKIEGSKKLFEGAVKLVKMNIYERNPQARKKSIEYHNAICKVCDFDFFKIYGEMGNGFIHIHHLKEISEIKKEYIIDYKNDLIPVCPNCHAMLHKKKPAYTIEELKKIIVMNKK